MIGVYYEFRLEGGGGGYYEGLGGSNNFRVLREYYLIRRAKRA